MCENWPFLLTFSLLLSAFILLPHCFVNGALTSFLDLDYLEYFLAILTTFFLFQNSNMLARHDTFVANIFQ